MNKRIEYETVFEFSQEISRLRQNFPELAGEIDKCLFDVLNNHTPKCGLGTCECQTMTFAKFHDERNTRFGTGKRRAKDKL